jgi:heptosyltransferase-1
MHYKNILIIKLSAIGDIVHAIPAAHALKTRFPAARVTWIVEKAGYSLLTNNPHIDEIIIFDKPKFKSFRGLIANAPGFIASLRQRNFDLALDFQGLFKSSAIAALSGAPERFVYENTREGSALLCKRIVGEHFKGHVVDRYLDVVRSLGCKIDDPVFEVFLTPEETDKATDILETAGLGSDTSYVVLALGANWPNKIWPAENFAALSDHLYAQGLIPIAIGSPIDLHLFEKLSAAAQKPPVNLIGKTSLKELAFAIKHAKTFIGGDTGPMHLAAAMHTPVVALMGPTDKNRNGPYPSRGNNHRVLIAGHACAGCWQRKCPKNIDCLAEISVDEVFEAVVEIVTTKNN